MNDPLSFLIDPVDASTFFQSHWENVPLLHKRDDAGYFSDIFSFDAFQRLLTTVYAHKSDDTEVRLAHHGAIIPFADFCQQRQSEGLIIQRGLNLDRVFELFGEGATIIVNRIHNMWPPLGDLALLLEKHFGAVVQVNAYLTPPGSKGFGIHYDTHDVFAIQISGTKTWRLYDNYMPQATVSTARNSKEIAAFVAGRGLSDVGPLSAEFNASAGDVVYIPRGFAHDANSTDRVSLHLTIGVHPVTWEDIMHAAVDSCVKRDPVFRSAVAAQLHETSIDTSCIPVTFTNLLDRMRQCDVLEIVKKRIENDPAQKRVSVHGQLAQIANTAQLQMDSTVRRNPRRRFDVNDNNGYAIVSFNDVTLQFPNYVAPHLKYIQSCSEFKIADMPGGLDDAGKLVLVRRLVREGLLEAREGDITIA